MRVGEQERDAIVAHGLSYFLKESMLVRGDEFYMAVCNLTGMIAIYNDSLDLFISPFADGPVKFVGEIDSEKKIDKITKFGRDFSIVRIPYAFKLLIQELSTLNINMRIITDKNIDQISSMNNSSVINDLDEIDAAELIKSQSVVKSSEPNVSLSVEELKQKQSDQLEKTIQSSIVDVKKDKLKEQQEDDDEEELLKALEELENPTLDIGEKTTFEPDDLPDINSVPLIGKVKPTQTGQDKQETVVQTPIDDPETPDEIEEENLKLLTDIKEEEGEEEAEEIKKTVEIK